MLLPPAVHATRGQPHHTPFTQHHPPQGGLGGPQHAHAAGFSGACRGVPGGSHPASAGIPAQHPAGAGHASGVSVPTSLRTVVSQTPDMLGTSASCCISLWRSIFPSLHNKIYIFIFLPRAGRESSEAGPSSSTSSRPDYSAILGDIEIPEGVDPSFLAALPEDMRQEVIAEQLR